VIADSVALARIIIAMDYDQSGIATTYDEARALTPARRRHWQRLLSAHVDRTAISLVIDLGCGTGRFSEMLAAVETYLSLSPCWMPLPRSALRRQPPL
jgi:SAM-dependent methyltransferase